MVGGLVEQHQVAGTHQRARQREPEAPAAGEFAHRALALGRGEAQAVEQLVRARRGAVAVDGGEARVDLAELLAAGRFHRRLERAEFGVAVQHEVDGLAIGADDFLLHRRDAPVGGHARGAGIGLDLAAQQREQRGFAAAVLADHAHALAGVDAQFRVGEQRLRAARERDAGKMDHRRLTERAAGVARSRSVSRRRPRRGPRRWRTDRAASPSCRR